MKEKEDSVILYLSILQNVAKKLQEVAYKYKTENKELSRQLSNIIVKIDTCPFQNLCLILKGYIENGTLTINEMTVWQHIPDFYQTITKVDGDLRDRSGTLYINMKDKPVINFVRANVISEFITEQIQSGLLPRLNRSYIEETLSFPYPEKIGICKELTKEDIERAQQILPKFIELPFVSPAIFELDKGKCYFLMILDRDTHRSGPHYLLQSFLITHASYENIIAGRHYYSKIPSNVTLNLNGYTDMFRKLGFVFSKPNNKENENRLQEQETVGREGYTGCVLYGGKDVPRCAIGHLRNKERVEIKAVGVRVPQAHISSRCAKVLRT